MSLRAFVLGGWVLGWTCAGWAEEAVAVSVTAPLELPATPQAEAPESAVPWQQGLATWYGGKRWHGRRTASGERFDRHALTAAHPSLPLGSWVRVVNQANGQQVQVRINDRGPHGKRFIIDLSEAAAEHLGFRRQGRAQVALHLGASALP